MNNPKATDVKKGISVLWETLQCPICLDLMTEPVSTKCDHQFCRFCLMKLLDSTKQNRATCPVCKAQITKRSLQESPGFQRLVAGLQDMIQAYEHDTGTNYLTGMLQQKGQSAVTDVESTAPQHDASSEEAPGLDCDNVEHVDDDDLPKSHSSTIAAQNGFARLMGLEDSSPLTAENEGLDSGLGGAAQASDRRIHSSVDNAEPAETDQSEVMEKATHKTRKQRRVSTLDEAPVEPPLMPDGTERPPVRKSSRKKRNGDKVLDQKQKKSLEKVAEWLMKVPPEGSLESEKPNEDDGADSDSCSSASTINIWQRRSDGNPGREAHTQALEDRVFGAVYKRDRRGSRTVSPPHKVFAKPSTTTKTAPEAKREDLIDDVSDSHGKHKNISKDEADVRKQPERRSKRTRSTEPLADADLLDQANANSESKALKKPDQRKTIRSARATNPLVLVGSANGEPTVEIRPRTEEVQIHIENYSSSEDPEIPVTRNTRRSSRLHLFMEDVQEGHKKANIPEEGSNVAKQPEEALEEGVSHKRRNGCVCDEDVGGIENLERASGFSEEDEERSFPEGPDNEAPAVDPTPESRSPAPLQLDPPACLTKGCGVENQEERNDSEVDTEQLLRSFKATKRKSFHLGGPRVKRTRSSEPEGGLHAEDQDKHDAESDRRDGENSSETLLVSPGLTGNVVPEEPDHVVAEPSSPDSMLLTAVSCISRGSVSSLLPPNGVSNPEREGPLSDVPEVIRSGLCFMSVEPDDLNDPSKAETAESQLTTREEMPGSGLAPTCASEAGLNAESSLTPDGLLQTLPKVKLLGRSGVELSAQSSIQTLSRKRQRLQSSSDSSDCTGEELPTLTEIFGASGPPCGTAPDQESSNPNGRDDANPLSRPPASPSPDAVPSSQASVDLFGTPEECDGAVNDPSVSVESSQFSNEVLVSQKVEMQKELLRLEKLMALVSEVLQEKEDAPAKTVQSGKITAAEAPDRRGSPSDRRGSPSDHRDPSHRRGSPSDRRDLSDRGGSPSDPSDRRGSPSDRRDPSDCRGSPSDPSDRRGSPSDPSDRRGSPSDPSDRRGSPSDPSDRRGSPSDRRDPSDRRGSPSGGQEDKENASPPGDRRRDKMVLVSSGLGPSEQVMVKKFAKRVCARLVSQVTAEVTHVIMHTDQQLVCERTLKYFLGIAGRKWVVSFQWISESFRQKKLLQESVFEVRGDVVNGSNHQGPMRARLTEDSNLLMRGFRICFQGPFSDMTTDQMELMVELCGASVIKDPLHLDGQQKNPQLLIVQPGAEPASTCRGVSRNAAVVTRGWLLDTVATYTLQNYSKYTA